MEQGTHGAHEKGSSSSGHLMQCFCTICKGLKWWSRATVYRHLSSYADNVSFETTQESLSRHSPTHTPTLLFNILEDAPSPPTSVSPTNELVQTCSGPLALSLQEAINSCIVDIQTMWDKAHVPIGLQGQMLNQLFGSLQKEPTVLEVGGVDHRGLSLGKLLTLAGPEWQGDVGGGFVAPSSWKHLQKYYKSLGLVEAKRFRLCTGSRQVSHKPHLMQPSLEDVYEGLEMIGCQCRPGVGSRFKRDCSICVEKCPCCSKMRKDVLAFEYMPIGLLLASMCRSRSMCHKLLHVWRNKDKWLGKDIDWVPEKIEEHYDGSKFRECQAFWDPEKEWETPVICQNTNCSHLFRASPTKCEELVALWNEHIKHYTLCCTECSSRIHAPKKMEKVSIRNTLNIFYDIGFVFA